MARRTVKRLVAKRPAKTSTTGVRKSSTTPLALKTYRDKNGVIDYASLTKDCTRKLQTSKILVERALRAVYQQGCRDGRKRAG